MFTGTTERNNVDSRADIEIGMVVSPHSRGDNWVRVLRIEENDNGGDPFAQDCDDVVVEDLDDGTTRTVELPAFLGRHRYEWVDYEADE